MAALHANVDVPIHQGAGGLFLVDVVIEGRTMPFVIDTGAGIHVMSDHTAAQLGIPLGELNTLGTASADVTYAEATADLLLGDVLFPAQPFAVLPRKNLTARMLGIKVIEIQGILGWPILASGRTTLDFRSGRLRIVPSNEPLLDAQPLTWRGAPIVGGLIETAPAQLVIDTGASLTMLHRTGAEAAGLALTGGGTIAGGAGGGTIPVKHTRDIAVQTIGKRATFNRLDVTLEHTGPKEACDDGSIGMDFLRDNVLTLDWPQRSARLH